MPSANLRVYSEFSLYGKSHKVVAIDPPHVWFRRTDGEDQKMSVISLINHPTYVPGESLRKQKTVKLNIKALATISEKKREEVSARFEMILPLILLDQIKEGNIRALNKFHDKFDYLSVPGEIINNMSQEALLERIINKQGVVRSTLLRYKQDYINAENNTENGGLEGLVSQKGKGYTGRKDNMELIICDPKHTETILDILYVRKTKGQIKILKDVIENHYLTKQRISISNIEERINRKCDQDGEEEISYSTIRNIINRIDDKAKETYRDLRNAKKIYDEVARGYANRDALGPLDIIQIDHTRLDLMVIDEVTGVVERPWITLGIDVFSRMPWCVYISFEPPSMDIVRKAIQHGVFVKDNKVAYGTENDWEAFGIPNIIYVDNGLDFKGTDIKRLVNETLQSEIMHRPVKVPHFGAVIERLFRTINTKLIHQLLGTTKSNPIMRGDINSEADACLTLNQIRRIMNIFLTDIYPIEQHKGLSLSLTPTPLLKYRAGIQEDGYPDWIERQDEDKYKIDFLLTSKKPYTRDGVRWENKIYKNKDEKDLIAKRTVKYVVKYDIDDISKIYLLHPKKEEFLELKCVSPPYEELIGVNRFTYKRMMEEHRKTQKDNMKTIPGRKQVRRAFEKIQEEIEAGQKHKKTLKKLRKMEGAFQISITKRYADQQQNKQVEQISRREELLKVAMVAEEKRKEKYHE
ncbi:DDE-type integrase/transposase/recombinase [Paenibacillus sp. 19GGS1-52]|uniref:Mu transposase C-terminal domain-containing protein n=1 Tax=Paenibacillus sp. 19GGS1-52 TaxID=2758563 RepID=UPI001EFB3D94|nr:Mu transposase C-terminal domain-containing protein [Paenibacillus sp. 19GGS1-52]ULO07049.1 DDE-type integrase/transposase/recombinase [Paenibacillus sp. 19GGS1-52]